MSFHPQNPLIVQSDRTVLLETASDQFEVARDALSLFAELVKSPEHIHTYRITPLSLWNAAALGLTAERVEADLERFSKYEVPSNLIADVREFIGRYGRIKLEMREEGALVLRCEDRALFAELVRQKKLARYFAAPPAADLVFIDPIHRGSVKHVLITLGHPVEDLAGYAPGDPLELALRSQTLGGAEFALRDYQREAVGAFWAGGGVSGGSGVIVLPCGAGKTIVAIGSMEAVGAHTLVLTTNTTSLRQWRDEILDKTTLTEDQIAEYSGYKKQIGPVTLTTYQLMTYRKKKGAPFEHFALFNERNWGLIVYDEVHLLPAPVFRAVANLQSRRRLGLTATLVREDGREEEVFSLIGPKKYDVPWRVLEKRGYIAQASCTEIRVPFSDDETRLEYAVAETRDKHRLAATNPAKVDIVTSVLEEHSGDPTLVIGQYLDQLDAISERTGAPVISGRTPQSKREDLYERFRRGELPVLVVSKVANFAVDLPDASVAIQVSGTFGSRQEEAQRLGRILRPKGGRNEAHFYSVVTRDSVEQEYANRRQLFLTEQGYRYQIEALP